MKLRTLFVCLACLVSSALADTSATLAGRISDPNGAMIPKAKVEVTNSETSLKRSVESNSEGLYVLPNLPPGRYQVQVQAQGFETLVHDGVVLRVQDIVTQNYSMKIGAVSTSVTIEGGASIVQAESGAVGTVIDRRFVENMPLNGRSFQSLITLTPGVVLTKASGANPGQFSVNGQRANSNYMTIDGVSANIGIAANVGVSQTVNGAGIGFNTAGATSGLLSVDALQEFRIQTSSVAPEFGPTPGGQISIVTRSGSNQLHGSLFEYFRNDLFDANDWFANRNRSGKPPLRQNDFGGVLGGPVVLPGYSGRDKTFFFISYEGLRLRQPQAAEVNVPSTSFRQSLPAAIQPLFNAFPIAADPGNANGFARFPASYSNPYTTDAGSIRLDRNFPGNVFAFLRYSEAPSDAITRTGALSQLQTEHRLARTFNANVTWIATPHLSHQTSANYSLSTGSQYTRLDNFGGAVVPPQALLVPSFIDPSLAGFTFSLIASGASASYSNGRSADNLQRQFNFRHTLSYSKSNHQFKFGFDFRKLLPEIGPLEYSQVLSISSAADARAPKISSLSQLSNTVTDPRYLNLSLFAQDEWRPHPRWTLTYGVRWEMNPPPTEANGNLPLAVVLSKDPAQTAIAPHGTNLYQTKFNNFAPRLGLAYRFRQTKGHETVFRGGIGKFYDRGNGSTAGAFLTYPFTALTSLPGVPFPFAAGTLVRPDPANVKPPYSTAFGFGPDFRLPWTLQWNVAVEQGLGINQKISASYVASLGRRLIGFSTYSRPNPLFTSLTIYGNLATSDYDSLQLQFQRNLSRGVQALVSYTWSHSIDDASDEINNTQARGSSDFDVRHAVAGALSADLPSLGGPASLRKVSSNWAVDAVLHAQSSSPVNITGQQFFVDGITRTSRPDLIAGVPVYLDDPNVPGGRKINSAAFAAAVGRQGTLGRNILYGFPLAQLDLTLRRDFAITERFHVQARAEAFNLTNHPNFGSPSGGLGGATFGQATTMLGRSLSTGGAGLNALYQIGGPRSMQFSLRLRF